MKTADSGQELLNHARGKGQEYDADGESDHGFVGLAVDSGESGIFTNTVCSAAKSTAGLTSASPYKGPGSNDLILPRRMSGGKSPPRPVVKTSMPGLMMASLLRKRSFRDGFLLTF